MVDKMPANDEPELLLKLYELNEIGIALSREKDHHALFEKILLGAITLTNADGGTLYSVTENDELQFEVLHTNSMGFHFNRATGGNNPFTNIPLYLDGEANDKLVVCHAALHDRSVNIDDVYCENRFDCSGTKEFDKKSGYHCRSLLTVPMKDHEGTLVGVLQLINAIEPITREVCAFSKQDEHMVLSLASQTAVMLSQMRLIRDLQSTFQGFVEAIGEAIDKKSQHTGMHCQRVPILTGMLGRAVNHSDYDYTMSEDELYELHMAALLHDCGKIATPIHIIDKATKLETVFDRIELIEARLTSYASQLPKEELEKVKDELLEDLAFIRSCNAGNLTSKEEDSARLDKIRSYQITNLEGAKESVISDDEYHNLLILRGTLNDSERKIMNDHVVNTIDMLKHLPLPKKLKQVPEIAGAHHEHMDGSGYPAGLTGDQMSKRARMLAIADVFEALTAPDRPYKAPIPLSKAVAILQDMAKQGHLDPELTEIFMKEKVYLEYAKAHLAKEQIDIE